MPRERPRDVAIDQIPVGPGYGVECVPIDRVPLPWDFGAPALLREPSRYEWWLVRFDEFRECWQRVRRLPWNSVVSWTIGDQRVVYHTGSDRL